MSVLASSCSEAPLPASPPPPQSTPPPAAYREQYADALPAGFPSHFTVVFTREYGMWKYRACTLEVSLFLSANKASLLCYAAERVPVTAGRDLAVGEAARLRRLVEGADLYRGDHIGVDVTPTDGILETIRLRPIAGGRAVVVVASGNRSFADIDGRRELVGVLRDLLSELVADL